MFTEDEVSKAIESFTKNDFWAEKLRKAPPGAQKRLALSFFFSENGKKPDFNLDEYRNYREYIEDSLDVADLDYLIENDTNDAARKHFGELKKKKQEEAAANPQAQGGMPGMAGGAQPPMPGGAPASAPVGGISAMG